MKTIEIKLYEFSELSEDAQKVAIEESREWVGETQAEIDGDSFHWTQEAMEEALGIWIRFENRSTRWGWNADGERWEEVSDDERYLLRYINWVMDRVDNRKTYFLPFEKSRYYHPSMTKRTSNIIKEEFTQHLTGEWTDFTFDKWMNHSYAWVRDHKTIDAFVDSLVREFRHKWSEDIEWGYSDDNVRDIIDGNGDLFLESGHKFNQEGV